jgi:signal transduction histidine kinase
MLLLVLILIVRRGENIIEQRALERLRLKEKLGRAEHLSALGEMVATVSHEIRNPLGIIRSSAELLKKKAAADPSASGISDIIVEEATRLNHIITDFLNFARPKDPNVAPCFMDEIIEKNLSFLAPQMGANGYTVEMAVTGRRGVVMADENMLYQAFLNLLINAMQAMGGGGKIFVGIRYNEETVTVNFDDEGPGVSEDLGAKIWAPFYTTKPKGTGLGLGIVKNIVEAHGGSIDMQNRPEGGARVTVALPRDRTES